MWVMWFHFHFQNCTDSLFIHFNSHFHVDIPTFYFHFSFYPKLSNFCSLGEMEAGILVSLFTFTSSRCNISVFVCHMGWISFSSHLYPKLLSFCSRREMGDDFGFTFTFYFHFPSVSLPCVRWVVGALISIPFSSHLLFIIPNCSVFVFRVIWVVGAVVLISFPPHFWFTKIPNC